MYTLKFVYMKCFIYYSSSSRIPPPGTFGPPARFAIIIWLTLSTVHATPTAYFKPHCFVKNKSKIPLSTVSIRPPFCYKKIYILLQINYEV